MLSLPEAILVPAPLSRRGRSGAERAVSRGCERWAGTAAGTAPLEQTRYSCVPPARLGIGWGRDRGACPFFIVRSALEQVSL